MLMYHRRRRQREWQPKVSRLLLLWREMFGDLETELGDLLSQGTRVKSRLEGLGAAGCKFSDFFSRFPRAR